MVQFAFNAAEVPPASSDASAPPGWHTANVVFSDMVKTSKGDGYRLSIKFLVQDPGPSFGSVAWASFNIQNPNPKAVEIGRAEYSALCHAIGILNVTDTEQLHGRPLKVLVEKDEYADSKTGELKTSAKATKFKSVNDPTANNQAAVAQQVQSGPLTPTGLAQTQAPPGYVHPPASSAHKKPWEK